MEFDDTVSSCDICAMEKSKQLAHPKKTIHDVNAPFQLIYADLMGPISPAALGGFRYISKITDQHTKWKEVYVIKSKEDAVDTIKCFVQGLVIPLGLRVERI